MKKNLKDSFLLKYKNEKENLPLTQRELNYYFENHVMEVSLQYSNLYKQILITFYLPLVPSGLIITLIGIILNYLIEKFTYLNVYKKPFKLNEKIAFFILIILVLLFLLKQLEIIFFLNKIHSTNFFEIFILFFYEILIFIPYNIFIRKFDISDAYSSVNKISYDDTYLTFSFNYERLNPKTQKIINYMDILVKKFYF